MRARGYHEFFQGWEWGWLCKLRDCTELRERKGKRIGAEIWVSANGTVIICIHRRPSCSSISLLQNWLASLLLLQAQGSQFCSLASKAQGWQQELGPPRKDFQAFMKQSSFVLSQHFKGCQWKCTPLPEPPQGLQILSQTPHTPSCYPTVLSTAVTQQIFSEHKARAEIPRISGSR